MRRIIDFASVAVFAAMLAGTASGSTLLLDQDFENPSRFQGHSGGGIDGGADVDARSVNDLYGNQPPGFTFGNTFSVETINVTDSENPGDGLQQFKAIGGYAGDFATSGDFVVGMLSSAQDDRLGLTFDIGSFDFLNFSIDVTSLDLNCCGGGPGFVETGVAPAFRFSLFEEAGSFGIGGGTLLDSVDLSGTASARNVLDFTNGTFGLDAASSTDGVVTLQIDLLQGGYAAFDNLRIVASNTAGEVTVPTDPGVIPLPAAGWLLVGGLGGLVALRRRA